jgi:hypothetical protein
MKHSAANPGVQPTPHALFKADPLRALALTVEEAAAGEFRWRILERAAVGAAYESLCCADKSFAAYDTALAVGYGELQRLIGPDLQFGPRQERGGAALPGVQNGSAERTGHSAQNPVSRQTAVKV